MAAMAALAAALLIAAPASAVLPSAGQVADVRCLIASASLTQSGDKTAITLGMMASLLWLGRLGPSGEKQLESVAIDQGLKMTAADIKSELQRCGAEMDLRGDALQGIGDKLKERAKRIYTN